MNQSHIALGLGEIQYLVSALTKLGPLIFPVERVVEVTPLTQTVSPVKLHAYPKLGILRGRRDKAEKSLQRGKR